MKRTIYVPTIFLGGKKANRVIPKKKKKSLSQSIHPIKLRRQT